MPEEWGRGAVGGGARPTPLVFSRSVNPILPRGADYARLITNGPARFLNGAASLHTDDRGSIAVQTLKCCWSMVVLGDYIKKIVVEKNWRIGGVFF